MPETRVEVALTPLPGPRPGLGVATSRPRRGICARFLLSAPHIYWSVNMHCVPDAITCRVRRSVVPRERARERTPKLRLFFSFFHFRLVFRTSATKLGSQLPLLSFSFLFFYLCFPLLASACTPPRWKRRVLHRELYGSLRVPQGL